MKRTVVKYVLLYGFNNIFAETKKDHKEPSPPLPHLPIFLSYIQTIDIFN